MTADHEKALQQALARTAYSAWWQHEHHPWSTSRPAIMLQARAHAHARAHFQALARAAEAEAAVKAATLQIAQAEQSWLIALSALRSPQHDAARKL